MMRLPAQILTAALLAAPLTSVLAAESAPSAAPALRKGPLSADQLRAVQGVGRAVLVAQQSQATDPEQAALKQDIEALSQDFDRAMAANLARPPVLRRLKEGKASKPQPVAANLTLTPETYQVTLDQDGHFKSQERVEPAQAVATPAFVPAAAAAQGVPVAGSDPYEGVRNRLDRIDARLQQHIASAQAQNKPQHAALALAGTIARLRADLQGAVADSADAPTRLAALKDRLRAQGFAAQRARANPDGSPAQAAPTPTITTLTRHR